MKMIKTLLTLFVAAFVFAGCSSTVTLGPDANTENYLSATAGTKGASVTLPLVRGEVKTTEKE